MDLNLKIVTDKRRIEVDYNSYFYSTDDINVIAEHLAKCILDMFIDTSGAEGWEIIDYWENRNNNLIVEFEK